MKEFITDPGMIEKRSMEIISEILLAEKLNRADFSPAEMKVVKRVIHTTADFEYSEIMEFHHSPLQAVMSAICRGQHVVTDTMMAYSGINKRALAGYGVEVRCCIGDENIAREAKERGITRAMVSMEHAVRDTENGVFVIGNAPTALLKLVELVREGKASPAAIIGVPVGFVGAAESKDILTETFVPAIITRGRKGGSNVAAAILNAIIYMMGEQGL